MENLLIGLIVFLSICVIIALIAAIIFYRDTEECQNTEHPLCPQYICPNGQSASRTTDDGKKQFSNNPLPSSTS